MTRYYIAGILLLAAIIIVDGLPLTAGVCILAAGALVWRPRHG